ncbi:hypothetical protein [Kitasatospora sp. NPDC101183]|uniref:hypothetical protein n=1 Tax=Kitasatospora sp. NPDC101183 TaxID=3364100 RepID=UPI003815068A
MTEARLPARRAPLPVKRAAIPEPLLYADVRNLSVDELHVRGVQLAKAYQHVEKASTTVLKSLAAVLIALRIQMDDPMGRSHDYRVRAAQIYLDAGIPKANQSNIQSNVRWHIGNLVRTVFTPEEVRDLGLLEEGPAGRKAQTRSMTTALVAAQRAGETLSALTPPGVKTAPKKRTARRKTTAEPETPAVPAGRATADHLRLAESVGQILTRMQPHVIVEQMTNGQREVLIQRLREVVDLAEDLILTAEDASSAG